MHAPTGFYDQRFLKTILFIINSIVLSLAITNGITPLYLGTLGIAIVCWFLIPKPSRD